MGATILDSSQDRQRLRGILRSRREARREIATADNPFEKRHRRTFLQTTGAGAVAARFLGATDPADAAPARAQGCADRLQTVKWRHYTVHFYQQETIVSPPGKPALDTWTIGPVLKMVAAFEESVKQHPLIPTGTVDPLLSARWRP